MSMITINLPDPSSGDRTDFFALMRIALKAAELSKQETEKDLEKSDPAVRVRLVFPKAFETIQRMYINKEINIEICYKMLMMLVVDCQENQIQILPDYEGVWYGEAGENLRKEYEKYTGSGSNDSDLRRK